MWRTARRQDVSLDEALARAKRDDDHSLRVLCRELNRAGYNTFKTEEDERYEAMWRRVQASGTVAILVYNPFADETHIVSSATYPKERARAGRQTMVLFHGSQPEDVEGCQAIRRPDFIHVDPMKVCRRCLLLADSAVSFGDQGWTKPVEMNSGTASE